MFDVPERILIRFQDNCLYHYEGQCSPCCLSIMSVMVLCLHGPLFSEVYPLEFDYANLEVIAKECKIEFKFCQFANARKRQHFLMLEV